MCQGDKRFALITGNHSDLFFNVIHKNNTTTDSFVDSVLNYGSTSVC
jgi:hypothetical protein